MDNFNHDFELEKQNHPENFQDEEYISFEEGLEKTKDLCPSCSEKLYKGTKANGADDYDFFWICKNCDYLIEA